MKVALIVAGFEMAKTGIWRMHSSTYILEVGDLYGTKGPVQIDQCVCPLALTKFFFLRCKGRFRFARHLRMYSRWEEESYGTKGPAKIYPCLGPHVRRGMRNTPLRNMPPSRYRRGCQDPTIGDCHHQEQIDQIAKISPTLTPPICCGTTLLGIAALEGGK